MAKRRRLKTIHRQGPGRLGLVIGGKKDWITLSFVAGTDGLWLFLQWDANTKRTGSRPVGRLRIMRAFAPKTADAIMRTFLRFAGYQIEGMTAKQRRARDRHVDVEPGLGIGKMRNGDTHLCFMHEKRKDPINFTEFVLTLTKAQLAAVCEHIAPALGWDLT